MKQSVLKGRIAEDQAADFLVEKGFKILDRNSYHDHCEIDIVGLDPFSNQVVFVEVKSVKSTYFGRPELQITPKKIRFLYKAAGIWLSKSNFGSYSCRFDVICIINSGEKPKLSHYTNAFVLGM